jgi:hypothetical protein
MRRTLVLGLAVLLAAATAAADTVITADEIIACSVESADASFLSLKLPQEGLRILYTRDIFEVRLSDSSRVAGLAAQLPEVRVALDTGQPVPPREDRAREMLRLRLERTREARAKGLPGYPDVVDTLPLRTSPSEMAARCRDMDVVLCECGRSDRTVAGLQRETRSEQAALHRLGLMAVTTCLAGTLGGVPGGLIGIAIGVASTIPAQSGAEEGGGAMLGCGVGGAVGAAVGVTIDIVHNRGILARHRNLVNDLVRRVNRAVVTAP